jgi:hypothetical protein
MNIAGSGMDQCFQVLLRGKIESVILKNFAGKTHAKIKCIYAKLALVSDFIAWCIARIARTAHKQTHK